MKPNSARVKSPAHWEHYCTHETLLTSRGTPRTSSVKSNVEKARIEARGAAVARRACASARSAVSISHRVPAFRRPANQHRPTEPARRDNRARTGRTIELPPGEICFVNVSGSVGSEPRRDLKRRGAGQTLWLGGFSPRMSSGGVVEHTRLHEESCPPRSEESSPSKR